MIENKLITSTMQGNKYSYVILWLVLISTIIEQICNIYEEM